MLNSAVKSATKELEGKNQALQSALEKLTFLSNKDPLTGANNRHFLEHNFASFCNALPEENYISLFLLDIDHFKHVNDTFGHDAGDKVLTQVVDVIRAKCRNSDWVIRWGGEEFLLVVPLKQSSDIWSKGESLRAAIADSDITISNNKRIKITCSIGAIGYLNQREKCDFALYTVQKVFKIGVFPEFFWRGVQ